MEQGLNNDPWSVRGRSNWEFKGLGFVARSIITLSVFIVLIFIVMCCSPLSSCLDPFYVFILKINHSGVASGSVSQSTFCIRVLQLQPNRYQTQIKMFQRRTHLIICLKLTIIIKFSKWGWWHDINTFERLIQNIVFNYFHYLNLIT